MYTSFSEPSKSVERPLSINDEHCRSVIEVDEDLHYPWVLQELTEEDRTKTTGGPSE